jgi:hypothetical protein
MNQLIPLIEDFLDAMKKVSEAAEELRNQAGQLPSTSAEDLPSKVDELNELCQDGIRTYNQAMTLVEDMQDLVGR